MGMKSKDVLNTTPKYKVVPLKELKAEDLKPKLNKDPKKKKKKK